MGRRKVETSQLIKTQKTLTKVFNQRKDGIMKKAFQLSTLCDVQVGVIIHGPNGDSPVVWPKDSDSLTDILRKYQKTSIEERRKRATDVSCFIKKDNNSAAQRNNEVNIKPEINPLLRDKMFDSFSVEQLMNMLCSLDNKIEAVKAKIDVLKNNQIINLPKCDEALQSDYGCGGVQQLNDVVHLPELPCANAFPVNDHYIQLLEQQVYEENLIAKIRYEDDMMMMNGENYCSNLNNNNNVAKNRYEDAMMMMMNGENHNYCSNFNNNNNVAKNRYEDDMMMMMNGENYNYCSNINNNNVDVADFTGFMEGNSNFNGAMVDQVNPLMSRCCNPFSLMPEQAEYDGVQLPLNYNSLVYF